MVDKTKAPSISPHLMEDTRRTLSAGLGLLARRAFDRPVQTRIIEKPEGLLLALGFMFPSDHLDVRVHFISLFSAKMRASREDRPLRVAPLYFCLFCSLGPGGSV